jgi:hypothetical protein
MQPEARITAAGLIDLREVQMRTINFDIDPSAPPAAAEWKGLSI